MKAASENLVPVTLELGGKSPTIVAERLQRHVRRPSASWRGSSSTRDRRASRRTTSWSRRGRATRSSRLARPRSRRCIPTLEKNPDYTSIVNDKHYARLTSYVKDAQTRGARVVELNPAGESLDPAKEPQDGTDARARRRRRHARHAGGDLRTDPAGRHVPDARRGDRLRQRPPAAARALLLQPRQGGDRSRADRDDLGRRDGQRDACSTSRRTTCPSAASGRAAWGTTTRTRGSTRSRRRSPSSVRRA